MNFRSRRLTTHGVVDVVAPPEEAEMERRVTPHVRRHTVATLFLLKGVDIKVDREFLAHASITRTRRYTRITKECLAGVLRKLHPL